MQVSNARFVLGAVKWEDLPEPIHPEIAFIGRSNVGKSSLINTVLGRRELARTSSTPGKTQQFNYYEIEGQYYFVDLPGYGYAKISRQERERWGRLIGRYLTERQSLRVVFHLVDSRHEPTAMDRDVMGMMKGSPVPYLILLTKVDKISGNDRTRALSTTRQLLKAAGLEIPVIATSSRDKRGREEIWQWIHDLAG